MKKERGLFIVFEGLDRCGKSTQVRLLNEYLSKNKHETELINFPDRQTMLGGIISSYLKGSQELSDEVIHLLFAANRWEKSQELINHLNNGSHVVCDRYTYSGVAFSAAKGLPFQWCQGCDSRLPKPDVVIYLQAPLSILSLRGDFGQERYEKIEFQTKVKEQFEKMIEKEKFCVVAADQDMEKVHQDIVNIIQQKLNQEREEVKQLWTDIFDSR